MSDLIDRQAAIDALGEMPIWTDDAGNVHIDANGAADAAQAWNRRASDERTD